MSAIVHSLGRACFAPDAICSRRSGKPDPIVTAGSRMTFANPLSSSSTAVGFWPAAMMSLIRGMEILPSGRTVTVADSRDFARP